MSWTYTWEIERLKVKDEVNSEGVTLRNAVCNTYWKITGTNADGDSASWSGATPFTAASVGEADFTDFESLTEAEVIGWVRNVVENDTGYMNHINEQLQKAIDLENEEEIAPEGLPWATGDDVTPTPTDADTETT